MLQQPKGAKADIAELEHVAALHQTGIYAKCLLYLHSRCFSLFFARDLV
jgi:hypothetical protein